MKKNKNSGFMLIETLLVSTFVLGVLTYLFLQFSALKRSYDDNFKYNTVPALYGIKNINQYIAKQNGYAVLQAQTGSEFGYTEFSCASNTCTNLLSDLNTEVIYFVKDNIFKNNINPTFIVSETDDELYYFAKKINFGDEDTNYHLIVKYKDGTFATMSITL